jgi:hypothetical protein
VQDLRLRVGTRIRDPVGAGVGRMTRRYRLRTDRAESGEWPVLLNLLNAYARHETRTRTGLPPVDFESSAGPTPSTINAHNHSIRRGFPLSPCSRCCQVLCLTVDGGGILKSIPNSRAGRARCGAIRWRATPRPTGSGRFHVPARPTRLSELTVSILLPWDYAGIVQDAPPMNLHL